MEQVYKKIQKNWNVDNMNPSSKVETELLYNDRSYNSYIYCDSLGRTRLHWYSDMRNIIHEMYYELSILYKDGSEVDQSPQM